MCLNKRSCSGFNDTNLNHRIMKEFIQKHWVSALGLGLIFTGFLYFLNLAMDRGWLPLELRIALSVTAGFSAIYFGFKNYESGKKLMGEVLSGMGTSILYATIGYLSFSEAIHWSTGALLVSMAALSILVGVIAVKKDMRVLFQISLIGGMITPFFIEAVDTMDQPLFLYMLMLNLSALIISVQKNWGEMKVIAFIGSLGLYAVYYSLFDPVQWTKPFFYVSSLFVVYTVGLLVSSFKQNKSFEGVDLYLGVINSVNFVFWSIIIFKEFSLPHAIPLLIVGVIFLGIATFIYLSTGKKMSLGLGTYSIIGLLVMAIAGQDLGLIYNEGGMNHVISASVWLFIIGLVYFAGRSVKAIRLIYGSILAFFVLIIYWYSVAWSVEWVEMFGIRYIPFLNAGALIWMGMTFLGLSYSRFSEKNPLPGVSKSDNALVTNVLALVSHLLIGGLLTIQILNLWEAYDLTFISKGLSLSLCWFIYSLILFLWGAKSRQKLFSILGGFVLLFSTCKVFLFDLSGDSSLQKVLFLMTLGAVTLLIAKVRNKALSSAKTFIHTNGDDSIR